MKYKLLYLLLFAFLFYSCSDDNNPNEPDIDILEPVINSVNGDTLKKYLDILTGVQPVVINGFATRIESRHKDALGNNLAADYIFNKFKSFGLNPQNQWFSNSGRNVIAEIKGSQYPDIYYVICAHYDSMPAQNNAPGADDNGSGTVAVMEAARIFSQNPPTYSIIFALWDEEEQGLIGSAFYAKDADEENKNIRGVVNLDMIAYDSDNDKKFSFVVLDDTSIPVLVSTGIEVIEEYNLGLEYQYIYGRRYSDHASFWDYNYNAITIIEDYNDFNAYYHTPSDNTSNINYGYLNRTTKLAVGIIAKSAL